MALHTLHIDGEQQALYLTTGLMARGHGVVVACQPASPMADRARAAGGLPEIIRHEVTGLLVPPREPEPLADAILRLLRDRPLGQRLAAAGRRLVEEEFSADSMVEGTLRVYQEVMDESPTRPAHL